MAPTGYTKAQIALHWIVAVLLTLQFLLHGGMESTFQNGLETGVFELTSPAIAHMTSGTIILLLVAWRLIIRRERGHVPAPEGEPAIFARLSRVAHGALYATMLLMPVTGAVAWAQQSEVAGRLHGTLMGLLLLLVLAHIGAVVVHQVVWKTGIIERMTKSVRD